MEGLFLTVWHMSLTASLVILAVLAVRLCLKKAPKVFSYALWVVVLARLLCPVTVDSPLGLVPSARSFERTAATVAMHTAPAVRPDTVPVPAVPGGEIRTPVDTVTNIQAQSPQVSLQRGPSWLRLAAWLWLCGVAGLAGYSLVSLLLLRRRLREAAPLEGERGVWLTDHAPTPFVLGLVRPRIYLPAGLPREEWDYILLHERTHIRRFDHVVKALAWLAVLLHWFNPLVWLAFRLAGRDMEMSCDEAVLKELGPEVRGDYSQSLLRLSAGKRLSVGPLAFGDGDAKSRIKNILHYKKPTLWVLLFALTAVAVAAVVLLTGRMAREERIEVEVAFEHTGTNLTSSFFVPEDVLEAAKDYAALQFPADGMTVAHWGEYNETTGRYEEWSDPPVIRFDGARLESMRGPWIKEWRGQQLEVWELNYEYHTDADADLVWNHFIVGGMYLTEDGWLCPTYPNSTFLIFAQEDGQRRYVDAIMNNTDEAGDDDFWADVITAYARAEGTEGTLTYSQSQDGGVLIAGFDGLYMEWRADGSRGGCRLYFAGDPAMVLPSLAGRSVEGTALWTDETRGLLDVTMNVDDDPRRESGTVWGDTVHFSVERAGGNVFAIRTRDFTSQTGGEPLTLGDGEIFFMAHALTRAMDGAEDYHGGRPAPTLDADHDGIREEARLREEDGITYLELWEGDKLLWRSEGASAHMGWNAVFLCALDDGDYLLRYRPSMAQGMADYSYQLFSLTPDGEEKLARQGAVGFDINLDAPQSTGEFDPQAIAGFMEEVNGLLAHSSTLLNTDEELRDTFYRTGRLYDDLGWLDGKPERFARDEDKSLLENLTAYQAALTRPEGQLPFDQPLEMEFLSGAGGWHTELLLRPDGSFEGSYRDSDMGSGGPGYGATEYVCQFHGRFRDMAQLTPASWSLTLDQLVLDTGRPVGEEWIEDRVRYVSSGPYGFDDNEGQALEPGAEFILYTPDASATRPGSELYGLEEQGSPLFYFWAWWPGRHELTGHADTLGCYGLRSLATERSFFGE